MNGFEEAIESIFPESVVQTCVVHLIRNSMRFVSYKDRRAMAADLRAVYNAPTAEAAAAELEAFAQTWDGQYPSVSEMWRRHWPRVVPFLDFPAEIRKVLYTTNAIEALNRQLRKYIKTRTQFPSDEAVYKALYLGLQIASKKWNRSIRNWRSALQQMAQYFEYDLSQLG